MAYADADYYNNTYQGHEAPDDMTLTRYLARSSSDIDAACLESIDTDNMTAEVLGYLKMATCARAEQYIIAGSDDPGINSAGSLGAFSIQATASAEVVGSLPLNVRCKMYLLKTGLLNRCVGRVMHAPYTC